MGASVPVTYRNILLGRITMGVHNSAALEDWKKFVSEQDNTTPRGGDQLDNVRSKPVTGGVAIGKQDEFVL